MPKNLVDREGIEPPSRRPSTDRSTHLSYRSKLVEGAGVEPAKPCGAPGLQPGYLAYECPSDIGADGEFRPHNRLLTRQLLYRLSYVSIVCRGRRQGALRRLRAVVPYHDEKLPRHITQSTLLKSAAGTQKKAPGGSNQPGLLKRFWKVRWSSLPRMSRTGSGHRFTTIDGEPITTVKRLTRGYRAQSYVAVAMVGGIGMPSPNCGD